MSNLQEPQNLEALRELDRDALLKIIDAAIALPTTLRGFAETIRYNNRDNKETWTERATTYERAAGEIERALLQAAE